MIYLVARIYDFWNINIGTANFLCNAERGADDETHFVIFF